MNKNEKKETCKGKGSYGYVNKVEDLSTGIVYAEKHLDMKTANSKEKRRFLNEFRLMNKYNHENLVKSYSIDRDNYTYIMEFCDSTLFDYIRANNNRLTFLQRKEMVNQLLKSIKYLHDDGVFHRDLSLKNIMIKKFDNCVKIKISDFGLAKDLSEPITSSGSDKNRGTFRDPLLEKFKDFNEKNEMYAIGYLLHYIFRGKSNLNLDRESNESLKAIIKKCTTTDSLNKRYNNIDELLCDIDKLEDDPIKNIKKEIKKYKNIEDYKFEIIEAAYNSKDNDVWFNQDLLGSRLETDNYNVQLEIIKPREKTRYLEAVDDLVKQGLIYISHNSKNNKQYRLTEAGYQFYEER